MLSIATSINDDENYEMNEGQVNLRGNRINGLSSGSSSALNNSVSKSSEKIGRLLKNEEANYDQ